MRRALRPCAVPGCPNYAEGKAGQCIEHRAAADRRKGSRQSRGYDAAWQRLRARKLRATPFCEWPACARRSAEVDHIDGNTANRAWRNLRAYCPYHHKVRTARDQPGGVI